MPDHNRDYPSHGLGALLIWLTKTQPHKVTLFRHAAALLGVPPPVPQPLDEALLSPMARSFYRARRHIGSRVIKPELGVDLLYPDYKAGLAAILQTEKPTN